MSKNTGKYKNNKTGKIYDVIIEPIKIASRNKTINVCHYLENDKMLMMFEENFKQYFTPIDDKIDIEKIKKEAFEEGYNKCKKEIDIEKIKDKAFKEGYEEGYNKCKYELSDNFSKKLNEDDVIKAFHDGYLKASDDLYKLLMDERFNFKEYFKLLRDKKSTENFLNKMIF